MRVLVSNGRQRHFYAGHIDRIKIETRLLGCELTLRQQEEDREIGFAWYVCVIYVVKNCLYISYAAACVYFHTDSFLHVLEVRGTILDHKRQVLITKQASVHLFATET